MRLQPIQLAQFAHCVFQSDAAHQQYRQCSQQLEALKRPSNLLLSCASPWRYRLEAMPSASATRSRARTAKQQPSYFPSRL